MYIDDSTDLSPHKAHKIYFKEGSYIVKRKIVIRYHLRLDTELILEFKIKLPVAALHHQNAVLLLCSPTE